MKIFASIEGNIIGVILSIILEMRISMNYNEALSFIHSLRLTGKKKGLENARAMLAMCGNPEKKLRFVHIAGTNGKGSTAAMISMILREAGYRTGLYTSPYIERYNERIQIDGVPILDEELTEGTVVLKACAERLEGLPGEFEFGTVLGLWYFQKQQCDIVVLEAGLGGMFDSTNVIEHPDVCVITALGYDHQKQLGYTMEEIAMAKAGIIKYGMPVVCYENDKDAMEVIRQVCKEKNTELYVADFKKIRERRITNKFDMGSVIPPLVFSYKKYADLPLRLLGTYQVKNAVVAIETIEVLRKRGFDVTNEHIRVGLNKAFLPVRLERVSADPVIYIDGSHNPQGMDATVKSLQYYHPDKKLIFVYGAVSDKDVLGCIAQFLPFAQSVYVVAPEVHRAMGVEELTDMVKKAVKDTGGDIGLLKRIYSCRSVSDGIEMARKESRQDDVICILGSLYLAGEARSVLRDNL